MEQETLKSLKARETHPAGYLITAIGAKRLCLNPEQCKLGRLPKYGHLTEVTVENKPYELMRTQKAGVTRWWLMPIREEIKVPVQAVIFQGRTF